MSDKSVGGQPGHEGTTRKMEEIPDEIECISSHFCTQCSRDLSDVDGELFLFHKKTHKDFTLGAGICCPKIGKFKTHKYKNVRKFVRICFNLLILSVGCGDGGT